MIDRRLTPSNFQRDEPLVSRRYQKVMGRDVGPGDQLHPPPEGQEELPYGVRLRLWLTAWAVYAKDFRPTPVEDESAALERSVTVESTGGGWYLISAPWLPDGEKVQGKDNADQRRAEIIAYGDPKGVTVEGGEGGWFTISAAWLAEPEKVQGHDAAETRAIVLRLAGPPEGFDPNAVQLTGSDAFDALYTIGDSDVSLGDLVAAAQAASGNDPAQWNALDQAERDTFIQAELDRRQEAFKAQNTGQDGQAATEEVKTDAGDGVVKTPVEDFSFTDGSNGYFEISGPGLAEPIKVRGREAFEAKLAELRAAAGITAETPASEG